MNRLSKDHSLVLQSKMDTHDCSPTLNDTTPILKNTQLLAGFNGDNGGIESDIEDGKEKGKDNFLDDDDDNDDDDHHHGDPTKVIFSGDSLAAVHILNINREYLECDNGQWLEIPFLGSSDEVAWGSSKEDDEEKLSLHLYVPHLTQRELRGGDESHSSSSSSQESHAFLLIYHDDQSAAILQGDEYEDEEGEGEEEDGGSSVSVV